ncbi:AMP-binding protein [Microbulbifer thermotolerans]|uniref:Long-chain-fatty-acid--CoA ligase n=1 Tax=Microbulbifer thermotolerans TaxID=252514 RepID=A0A143HM09_MICTH|nr:AMP-binding protein [Microbulbifer thermotolerans]AMX02765.1 long-chain fatty acid--CoA ligase [Microbulbifer thermotolerans]MCX2779623.1 AMP-binding protein [Microbulbifer thermotolerans]MCX2782589.1 AMP-binding protein [Microbulbifer thermotolerans]MCX2794601.1 AMP-binding protein [Microbulbifer thermotolerans]MCX2804946.1 AMP-binding protein [Microbulbifer thermotolerans]
MDIDRSILDVFKGAWSKYSDRPAFTCLGHTLSIGDIDRLSAQFASYLQNHTNLEPGDRIAVQLPNVLQYPVVVFGALRAGLVLVNTNPLYTQRELKHQLNDSGAKAMVVLANIADTASAVVSETSVEKVIVTEIADLHSPLKRTLINGVAKYIKKMVPDFSFDNQISFREAMSLGAKLPHQDVQRAPEEVAVLQYTGGTTGVAKGAMLTNRNLVANMEQVREALGDSMKEGEEFYVAPLPLYHIYAFTIHCMCLFATGNHSLLIPNPRDIPGFVKSLKGKRFTGFCGLNTLFNGLMRNPQFAELDFSKLHTTCSGGMALTRDTAKRWEEMTGCVVLEGYGMTETSPVVSFNPTEAVQLGTVGVPVPGTEVKVVDENGNDLPNNSPGELCVRGPQVMKGYWQRPEATAEVLDSEGWLRTGDMAVIQDDGYIKIVDRKKDMIIVSGFNVYPNEVEDVVSTHPKVAEVAAIGVPHDKSGEVVKLFVVKADASLSEEEVIAFCRENMTAYKVPKQVEFREDLPKTNVGKILRRELRDEELKKIEAAVSV